MSDRPRFNAWRDPAKIVITKERWGNWWLVTLYARRTLDFRTYDEAREFAVVVANGYVR
jgi:hypothetical protein